MTKSEIATLFASITFYDGRFDSDAGKIHAWFQALDGDLNYDTARDLVAKHYGNTPEFIMPAHVNALWRAMKREAQEKYKGARIDEHFMLQEGLAVPPERVRSYTDAIRRNLKQFDVTPEAESS